MHWDNHRTPWEIFDQTRLTFGGWPDGVSSKDFRVITVGISSRKLSDSLYHFWTLRNQLRLSLSNWNRIFPTKIQAWKLNWKQYLLSIFFVQIMMSNFEVKSTMQHGPCRWSFVLKTITVMDYHHLHILWKTNSYSFNTILDILYCLRLNNNLDNNN